MKQMQFNKNTIAWFKIAEYVSRGEKERALGVYRLLSYSFNDDAVARQLEADIYFSFSEYDSAIVLYRQAMDLYQKSNRVLEAVAVCEHLIVMCQHDMLLRRDAIRLYISLDNVSKIQMHICKALDDMNVAENKQSLQELLSTLRAYSDELYEYAHVYLQNMSL
jgi:tetratricopeptide (TPR) repeat protein